MRANAITDEPYYSGIAILQVAFADTYRGIADYIRAKYVEARWVSPEDRTRYGLDSGAEDTPRSPLGPTSPTSPTTDPAHAFLGIAA
jgi:hypothetical protein